jgi:hypothetical protein
MVKTITALSHADLGYLVFFSDAFIACVPWYQSTRRPTKRPKKKHAGNDNKNRKKRQDKNNSSKKKGYTAANGYFGFNAVAQLGPGIQK